MTAIVATIKRKIDYGLNISVEDIYGNTRSFTIRIRVIHPCLPTTSTAPTTPTGAIPLSDTMILFLGIGAAVIVVIVVIRRRKGNY